MQVNDRVELTFQTNDGPIVVQICAPVRTPEGVEQWTTNVIIDGRNHKLIGEDPLHALASGVVFASIFLDGTAGLDPPLDALGPVMPWWASRKRKEKKRKDEKRKAKKRKDKR